MTAETRQYADVPVADLHCHLDFMADMHRVAAEARALGMDLFSVTVTPEGFLRANEQLAQYSNVRVGLGLHPWWLSDGRCSADDVDLFARLAPSTRFIGEIGLDFGKNCTRRAAEHGIDSEAMQQMQLQALEAMLGACAGTSKLFSLHVVRAEKQALDLLERLGVFEESTVILHWYCGPSDQLQRAIQAGCYFSVGPRMVASKRGREYVKAIPIERMLLETDSPLEPGRDTSAALMRTQLFDTAAAIREACGIDPAETIVETSKRLLGTV